MGHRLRSPCMHWHWCTQSAPKYTKPHGNRATGQQGNRAVVRLLGACNPKHNNASQKHHHQSVQPRSQVHIRTYGTNNAAQMAEITLHTAGHPRLTSHTVHRIQRTQHTLHSTQCTLQRGNTDDTYINERCCHAGSHLRVHVTKFTNGA